MIYLVDTDVGLTLCELDCIQDFAAALGVKVSDLRFNTEYRKVVGRTKTAAELSMTPDGHARAAKFAKQCSYINVNDIDEDDFILASNAGANAGEAELMASIDALYPAECVVITGDQNAIRDVYNNLEDCDMRRRLNGNVLCIEQVLLKILDKKGYAYLEPKLKAAKTRLSWLKPYFKAKPCDEKALRKELVHRIGNLHLLCPELLRP